VFDPNLKGEGSRKSDKNIDNKVELLSLCDMDEDIVHPYQLAISMKSFQRVFWSTREVFLIIFSKFKHRRAGDCTF
jgi:hypothetical protein